MLEFCHKKGYNINMATILHCDANNFYASVEQKLNPSLIGIPLAVAGNPDKRHGIILAKSNEAKKYGVATGDTLWQARQKCPNIVFVSPHYDDYVHFSEKLFKIYTEYTDKVESFGIDECWLDVTESEHLFGSGENIANELRQRVKEELGITISVGVSFTKIFAKIGSDMKKPDATTLITKENYKQCVWSLPVQDLLMVGKKTTLLFKKLNINTIGDLANYDLATLKAKIGINGEKLKYAANGIELENVKHYYDIHIPDSVGNSTTVPYDITNADEAIAVITSLSEMVSARLRKHKLTAQGIGLGIKYNTFDYVNKTTLTLSSTDNSTEITKVAIDLLKSLHDFQKAPPIRLLNVYTYKLTSNDARQLTMYDNEHDKLKELEKSIDSIRNKYGQQIVKKGIVLKHQDLCEGLVDKDFQAFKK